MELHDRVVVVTGGASGIGRALCRRFASEGARAVVVVDLDGDGAAAVATEIGGVGVRCDVASEAEVAALVEDVERAHGPIDLFCSNAAVFTGAGPLNTPTEVWQRQWEVNVLAHVHAVRAVLPGMLARGEGYLLHTASLAGLLTSHGNLPYAVTKHAVVGLAEWLSVTYGHRGIRVSCLCPSGVNTPMLASTSFAASPTLVGDVREPEEVAEIVVAGLAEERFLILTDPQAEEWLARKAADQERWLRGMRRVQESLERDPAPGRDG